MVAPVSGPRLRGNGWRRPLITLLVLLALAGLVWLAWSLSHKASHGGPGGAAGGFGGRGGFGRGGPPTTVGVATATRADVPITLEAIGTVTPVATVTVTPLVSGTITEVLFKEGQMVKRGQTLAVIDPRPFQMALLQAQGNLARDQAQLANAEITLGRDRTLLAQDSIARQDVDTQAALVRQLEGTVTADKAAVGSAQLNLGYSRVVAPVTGRVGLRQVDVGNYINAGASTGLVVLTEVSPIDVVFTVPQDQLPQVQQRAARAALPVTALDQTRTVNLGQGTFSTLDNQINSTTGTVKAKARFPNAGGSLFPSQFVNVRVQLDTLSGVVVIPPTAVRTGPRGQFVWILNANRTVAMRTVTTGPQTATQVAITSGLQPGEKVITEGADRLSQGAHVMLPGDRPQAGGFGGRGGRHRRGAGAGGGYGGSGAPSDQAGAPGQGEAPQGGEAPGAGQGQGGQGAGQGHGHHRRGNWQGGQNGGQNGGAPGGGPAPGAAGGGAPASGQ